MMHRAAIDYEAAFQGWRKCARHAAGDDLIVLDLGEETVNAVYAKADEDGSISILDYAAGKGSGYKNGVITDAPLFAETMEYVVGHLKKRNRIRTKKIHIVFSAPYISYFKHYATVNMSSRRRVTLSLIEEAIKCARTEITNLIEPAIQEIPVRYTLDSIYSGSEPPLGMQGSQLGVEVMFITAPESSLEQIDMTVRDCGYSVAGWWFSGVSSAESVMEPRAEAGVAVVDIGSGCTDVAVYQNGRLIHVGVIPKGGRDIDADLSMYLKESLAVANDIKCQFGCALPEVIRHNEFINVRVRGQHSEKLVAAREVANIIKTRIHDILVSVEEEIAAALPNEQISRLIFTGGTASLQGLPELAEELTEKGVDQGRPRLSSGTMLGFSDPACAALIGTVRLMHKKRKLRSTLELSAMTSGEKVRSWFGALVKGPVVESKEI